MAAWSDGYFTDIQYTGQFYSELAPGFMAYACLRQGVRPPALGPGSTYLELGCGQGYGLNLLAAANPGMDFWGVDFHPGQIANAQRLARAAGLSNIAFEDLSFEQMLALPPDRLPKFDVVAMHGVYSWVSPQNRAFIVQILDRVLKPGGMVYVSYNCLPGWAPLIPLQRFVVDYVSREKGDPEVTVVAAMKAAMQLLEGDAGYFKSNASLKQRIEENLRQKPAYLIHEYLNEHSHPFFHAEVARELSGARLSFAASTNIADDLVNLAAPAALQKQINETQDRTWRQTLMDYAADKPFRRDVFVRGRNTLGKAERDALLAETRFTLLRPPQSASFEFPIPIGQIKGAPAVYQPIMDVLADGPRSFADLARLPQFANAAEGALLQAVTLLIGGRQIHPAAPDSDPRAGTAPAFNRAVLERLAFDEVPSHLAASAAGSAVRVDFAELMALEAASRGQTDLAAVARGAWASMARTGRRLLGNGGILKDQASNEAALVEHMQAFNRTKLPLFRKLGVI